MNYLQEIDYRTPGIGDLYDELPLWSAPFGLLLLDHVPLRRGITILDVGAGTGFLTIELAQRCGDDSQVIAVDPWEAAVTRLRRKVSHLGLTNVRTLVQDVATIDLPDASMDLIVSNLGINNFDDPEAALRACRRVAKPGADLLLTTNLVGHMAEFYETYRAVLIDMGFHDRIPILDAHVNRRATVESVRVLLERTGFTFVEAITGSFRERFIDGSALLGHYFMRLGFVPGWKEIAPEGAMERTFAALEQRLNALATEQGGLALTVPLACIHARVAR
jgi:arsenite methyltransferase